MSKIESKAEISDLPDSKWQSDHALWWFLERKGNGRTWQTEQIQLCSPTAIPAFITLQPTVLSGKKGSEQKLKHGTWVGFLLLSNDYVAHLPAFCAFRLPSRWNYSSLLKVFFIPYSMSWQLFPSQLGQVFLLFFNLKMITLLSQHARSPWLLGNRWHRSRRHLCFQEFNRSWVPITKGWNPSKCFCIYISSHSFSTTLF